MRMLDKWTITASAALLLGALLACKKKEEPPPEPPAPPPAPTASAEPPKEEKKDDKAVTRYGDKEKDESGTVRVIFANAKVYKEADDTTSHISTLSTGTLVNRKARYGNWMLVDWPSGVGELSPGWIVSKQLDDKILKIDLEKVKNQDAGVVMVADAAAVAVPDAAAVAVPDAAAVVVPDAAAPPVADAGKGGRLKLPIKEILKATKP
ncbi:MAG: hypothetical protein IPI67_25420 [Myxococcales bacterium]|nr:hypothetical protein [Myxococcales bacterium]